jgi:GNAT superfamily N-acetyltransferase
MNVKVEHLTKYQIEFYKPQLEKLSKQIPESSFRFVPQHKVFAVFVGEEMAAFAVVNNPRGHWVFRQCVVDRKWRGNGFQRLLIEARLDYIKSKGGRKVTVGIDPKNTKSLNNILSYGFKFVNGGMKHDNHWYQKLSKIW